MPVLIPGRDLDRDPNRNPEEIRRGDVERALGYIINHYLTRVTDEGIYYLRRNEDHRREAHDKRRRAEIASVIGWETTRPGEYFDEGAPSRWATRHVDAEYCIVPGDIKRWVGMEETVRVAYLLFCGEYPYIHLHFTNEEMMRVDGRLSTWDKGKKILEDLGFPCKNTSSCYHEDRMAILTPEKIIENRHAQLAFVYIRERNQQEEGIRYYKTCPNVENVWVVEFDGEEYYHREALKLSYLFALKEIGEITNEEPPFDAVYKKYISSHWIDMTLMRSIWNDIGFDPRESKNAAGSSNEEE